MIRMNIAKTKTGDIVSRNMSFFGKLKQKPFVLLMLVAVLMPLVALTGSVRAETVDGNCTFTAYRAGSCSVDTYFATAAVKCADSSWSKNDDKTCIPSIFCIANSTLTYGVPDACPDIRTAKAKADAAAAVNTGGSDTGGDTTAPPSCAAGTTWSVNAGACVKNAVCSVNVPSACNPQDCDTQGGDWVYLGNGVTGCSFSRKVVCESGEFKVWNSSTKTCSQDSNACTTAGGEWTYVGDGKMGCDFTKMQLCENQGKTWTISTMTCDEPADLDQSKCSQSDPSQCTADSCTAAFGTWNYTSKDCTFSADPAATSGKCSTAQRCDLIEKYLNPFIQLLSAGVGLAVTIAIIIGGIQYSSSAGDPQRASIAKGHIRNAIIALIVFMFLYAILKFAVLPGVI